RTAQISGAHMKIPQLPFTVTEWSAVPATEHAGETGRALWRPLAIGDARVRMVEYYPRHRADHWFARGHILYVRDGERRTAPGDDSRHRNTGSNGKVIPMNRLAWIAASLFGLLALAGAGWSAFGPERIILTEPLLQERINRQLPREFRGVTVERAAVSLADGR